MVEHVFSRVELLERQNAQGRSPADLPDGERDTDPLTPPISQTETPGSPTDTSSETNDEGPRAFTPQDDVQDWLKAQLTEPTPAKLILANASNAGHPRRAVEHAKWQLGITSTKIGSRWYWLPPA
ncbi:hypothetical protein TPB0596_32110 [Tsukamurella pulmonis]|nr:hypothetical protein TPB0596_32110 [Tsukamurella pulmonis]